MEYNVLIAEDDESIVELLTLYLNSNGFNVISANDGEAAMELLRHRKTDIVLVDIMMSKMNGYELSKRFDRKIIFRLSLFPPKMRTRIKFSV